MFITFITIIMINEKVFDYFSTCNLFEPTTVGTMEKFFG